MKKKTLISRPKANGPRAGRAHGGCDGQRKEDKVLRRRLGAAAAGKESFPLASAQDDGGFKTGVVPGTGASAPAARRSTATTESIVARVARKLARRRALREGPRIDSFAEFLRRYARVKSGAGYEPYHFRGREALRAIVERLDQILSSGETDCSLAICGGAQFGKTVLMLNLLAYLVAARFRNVGYYLPDDDLVNGLVDGKLRPDVLDQIPWLARLIAVGKTLTATGRAVNRKGAFLCTDGSRTALAFMRGLGKIPTSFSMDVVVQDEKDDLPEEHARFLAGRMTASNLRLSLLIGTQRYHGAGQNLAFTEGTQHVGLLACAGCGERVNPETAWPGVCRLVVEGRPSWEWPRLTLEGNFELRAKNLELRAEKAEELKAADRISEGSNFSALSSKLIPYSPEQSYQLCCPGCGGLLDREKVQWHAQAPEQEKLRRWSYRISQLLIPAIELEQIVAAWQRAVRDGEQMAVFCTDRLALPKSSALTLTPGVLEAARGDYNLELRTKSVELGRQDAGSSSFSVLSSAFHRYAGLDMGDQCWFVARAVEARAPHNARLLWVEAMAAERVRSRVPELFRELGIAALCVDAGPLRDLARDVVFILNEGRSEKVEGRSGEPEGCSPSSFKLHPSALQWHEASQKWRNVRAMAVEFTQSPGGGLRHKYAQTLEGRAYPLLAANRDETIERVVRELLPPGVGDARLIERPDGTAERVATQRFLLPAKTEGTREVLDLYERHLLAGARQERSGNALRYLDKCENHFLLATAYAALAELVAPIGGEPVAVVPMFRRVAVRETERSLIG